MRKRIIHLSLPVLVICLVVGCSKPLAPVTQTEIAGMPLDAKTATFSRLSTPIAPDALVQVPGKHESIIVNIFPADENGNVRSGAKPEVIMASKTDCFKLNKTMSKDKLTAGTYLMNIVYGGQTERVVFTVK